MSRVRSKNTAPEIAVRRAAHAVGLRFRLHRRDLPGTPDLVLPRWRVALFVNGCFWHSHANCPRARIPKSNAQYWIPKLIRNKRRDADNARALRKLGWRCVRIWECETKDPNRLAGIVRRKIIAKTPGGN
jgi:DNA mismatch endonuclease, patch repair protein